MTYTFTGAPQAPGCVVSRGAERFDRWATIGRQTTMLAAFQYAAEAVAAGEL